MSFALDFPTAAVVPYASPYGSLPAGWVKCDGTTYDRQLDAFAPLFALINYTYGGSGNAFRVPDLGQRIAACGTPGTWYGTEKVVLDKAQCGIPNHGHTVTETAHTHTITETDHDHDIYYKSRHRVLVGSDSAANLPEVNYVNDTIGTSYSSATVAKVVAGGTFTTDYIGDRAKTGPQFGGSKEVGDDDYTNETGDSDTTGVASAHENRMPYVVMQYIIKL